MVLVEGEREGSLLVWCWFIMCGGAGAGAVDVDYDGTLVFNDNHVGDRPTDRREGRHLLLDIYQKCSCRLVCQS